MNLYLIHFVVSLLMLIMYYVDTIPVKGLICLFLFYFFYFFILSCAILDCIFDNENKPTIFINLLQIFTTSQYWVKFDSFYETEAAKHHLHLTSKGKDDISRFNKHSKHHAQATSVTCNYWMNITFWKEDTFSGFLWLVIS